MTYKSFKKLSIIIVAKNEAKTIGEVLERLCKSSSNLSVEVIVVDGGSTDRTTEIVKSYPVRLVYQREPGISAARNEGIRVASGEIIAFLDADALPSETYVKAILNAFRNPHIQIGFGEIKSWNKNRVLARILHREWKVAYSKALSSGRSNTVRGCNMIFRRRVLLEAGCFDERFKGGSDENVVSWKLVAKGMLYAYVKGATVHHMRPATISEYVRVFVRTGKGLAQFFSLYPEYNQLVSFLRLKMSRRLYFLPGYLLFGLGVTKTFAQEGKIGSAFLSLILLPFKLLSLIAGEILYFMQ